MNKAEELIACLEGEIAKRDARIVELENAAESLRISRDYHHEQEVEYRRRWAGLNAAPVSEAKAQGVVMPERDAIREVFMRNGFTIKDGQDDLKPYVYAAAEELLRLAAPVQHPDDAAVDRFAVAMKAKLAASREKGRHGWQNATAPHLSSLLHEHMYKGDPLDVGNLAMMLHQNGQAIELPHDARRVTTPVQQVGVPDGSRLVTTDWLKRMHRDLDACQKLIWANLRGCDPSYYEDAQERLREIDAMLAAAPVQRVSVPAPVRDALARRCLWLAFCWNDHNFGPAHEEARKEALKHGIDSFDAANEWLTAAPAAPAADAGLVEALGYQVLFDAIAAATSVYANGAINISVQAFRAAIATHRAKGVV